MLNRFLAIPATDMLICEIIAPHLDFKHISQPWPPEVKTHTLVCINTLNHSHTLHTNSTHCVLLLAQGRHSFIMLPQVNESET